MTRHVKKMHQYDTIFMSIKHIMFYSLGFIKIVENILHFLLFSKVGALFRSYNFSQILAESALVEH